jgi:chromosome segregation ATPase
MNTTASSAITNEMLYELIKDLKTDMNRRFEQVDKRFEQVEKRFEQVDKRLEQVDKRLDEMFDLIRDERKGREKNEDKLERIYESRDRVCVKFARSWTFASFFIAISSAIIALFINEAFSLNLNS